MHEIPFYNLIFDTPQGTPVNASLSNFIAEYMNVEYLKLHDINNNLVND